MDFTITLIDERLKALRWNIVDVQAWGDNWLSKVMEKADRCIDEICQLAIEDETNTILTLDEKQQVRDYLDAQGIVLTAVKQYPEVIKMQIVSAARVKTAAERQAEFEASLLTK